MGDAPTPTAELYRRWARVEGEGSSPTYVRLAEAVAESAAAVEFLDGIDGRGKRQPTLVFAAMRWHGAPIEEPDAALRWLLDNQTSVRRTVLERRTQTNEVLRCASLLPVLAKLPQPLAVVEVGASAGLLLLLDRWRYRYLIDSGEHVLGPADSPLTLTCRVSGPVPLPTQLPEVAWAAGLDLHPLDVAADEDRRWLDALVWPEHEERATRLRQALEVARAEPPTVVAGDLVEDLPTLLAQIPAGLTTVVFHAAALAYVPEEGRKKFISTVSEAGAHRVGLEGAHLLPHLEPQVSRLLPDRAPGRLLLSLDDEALGVAHPHGADLRWFD